MTQTIEFQRPDGKRVSGHQVEPSGKGNGAGIVVIQEWWGLNPQIKGVAERLSKAGYRVLVPDLYRGKVTVEAKEAEHMMQGLDFADAATQDIRGAVQNLKASCKRVGVTGFCMGGALTLLTAANVPEVDAAAVYYGYPPLEYIDASKIKIPLLGHFGTLDTFFPIAGVDALEQTLKAAGVRYTFHRYEARHAFANETAINAPIPIEYNPAAAELAWKRTLEFFAQTLEH